MKDNDFKLAKERSKRYPAQTITDGHYADDMVLLENTPTQAKSLLHSLERAAGGIASTLTQTQYMCLIQRGDISTLKSGPLKLLDKFTYIESSVSLTKKDINMWLAEAWTAIDRLSVIWASDLIDKMKRSFSTRWYCYINALHGC